MSVVPLCCRCLSTVETYYEFLIFKSDVKIVPFSQLIEKLFSDQAVWFRNVSICATDHLSSSCDKYMNVTNEMIGKCPQILVYIPIITEVNGTSWHFKFHVPQL